MEWPAQSPDLNPIELLWEELDRAIRKVCPTSEKHLSQSLQNAWTSITQETIDKLIARMPRICKAVIHNNGRFFDEKFV